MHDDLGVERQEDGVGWKVEGEVDGLGWVVEEDREKGGELVIARRVVVVGVGWEDAGGRAVEREVESGVGQEMGGEDGWGNVEVEVEAEVEVEVEVGFEVEVAAECVERSGRGHGPFDDGGVGGRGRDDACGPGETRAGFGREGWIACSLWASNETRKQATCSGEMASVEATAVVSGAAVGCYCASRRVVESDTAIDGALHNKRSPTKPKQKKRAPDSLCTVTTKIIARFLVSDTPRVHVVHVVLRPVLPHMSLCRVISPIQRNSLRSLPPLFNDVPRFARLSSPLLAPPRLTLQHIASPCIT